MSKGSYIRPDVEDRLRLVGEIRREQGFGERSLTFAQQKQALRHFCSACPLNKATCKPLSNVPQKNWDSRYENTVEASFVNWTCAAFNASHLSASAPTLHHMRCCDWSRQWQRQPAFARNSPVERAGREWFGSLQDKYRLRQQMSGEPWGLPPK